MIGLFCRPDETLKRHSVTAEGMAKKGAAFPNRSVQSMPGWVRSPLVKGLGVETWNEFASDVAFLLGAGFYGFEVRLVAPAEGLALVSVHTLQYRQVCTHIK